MNSDNRYGKCCNCPARMSYGGYFTIYTPSQTYNELLKKEYGIVDEHKYRLFLQTNGTKVMSDDLIYSENNYSCKFNK